MKTTKFKDSELGSIPKDWEVKRLGDVWERFATGPFGSALHASDYVNDGTPVINPMHILAGKIVPSVDMRIKEETRKRLASYRLRKNDIILGRRGEMGRAALVTANEEGWLCGTGSFVITLDSSVSPEYVSLYIRTPNCIAAMEDGAIGTTIPNLNQTIVANIPIALPPLPEQRRIAEALGAVDKLIDSLDAQIEKKRRIAQGLAHDLLGMRNGKNEPIRRLPGFKGGWRRVPFSQAFTMLNNNTYSRDFMCAPREGTVMNIHYGDVLIKFACVLDLGGDEVPCLKNGVRPNKDFIQDGDIVIADTAEDETVGRVVEIQGVDERQCVSGLHTVLCRPMANAFASGFLGYYMNSQFYHDQLVPLITGSKVSALSRSSFAKTELVIPPTLAEQQAIAEVLAAADSEIAGLEAKKRKYEQIKSGMMHDLLTGRVRVKGE